MTLSARPDSYIGGQGPYQAPKVAPPARKFPTMDHSDPYKTMSELKFGGTPLDNIGTPSAEGRKDDGGKLLMHLFPVEAYRSIVRVLMFGAKKYGEFNWSKLERPEVRYYNAAMRHLMSWHNREGVDPDTGESHLAHAACCIVFLLTLEARGRLSYLLNTGFKPERIECPVYDPSALQAMVAKEQT